MRLPLLRRSGADPPAGNGNRSRRAWLWRGMLLAAAIVSAAFVFRDALFGTAVDGYVVARRDIVQTVVATGRVTTPQRVSAGAVVTETVARIPVDEGQAVRRGDVLIELDDRDERAAVMQAEAAVAQSEARLRQLREVGLPAAKHALVQAEANLRLSHQQFERNRDLKARGYISQAALDDATRNLDVATSQLKAAQLQVQASTAGGADLAMAQTALDQAKAGLVAAKAKLAQTVIVAPADGVLIARNVEPGDVVQPGKELMVLAPTGETQIVVQVDEKNLSQLKLGQTAIASADAYPGERFNADLFYINPGIDALRGSVEVKLRVPQPPPYLRQDMTVSVDIEIARKPAALVAPADAIFEAAGAHPWVLAIAGGRARKTPVTLGIKGEGRVEILEGAAQGDRLIPVAAGVAPGQRVRIVDVKPDAP